MAFTLNNTEKKVYVAVTRTQQIWRLPLMEDGSPTTTGVAIQLSGGHVGHDGVEMDSEDGMVVCHLGVGVWRFDDNCLPTHLIHTDDHSLMSMSRLAGRCAKRSYHRLDEWAYHAHGTASRRQAALRIVLVSTLRHRLAAGHHARAATAYKSTIGYSTDALSRHFKERSHGHCR